MTLQACLYTGAVSTDLSELEDEEVGITTARRNLAELVNRVRLLGERKFLTSRDRRMAVLVPVEWYNSALKLDEFARRLQKRDPALFAEIARETHGTDS